MSNIKIVSIGRRGSVVLDGQDVSHLVTSVEFVHNPSRGAPVVVLSLFALDANIDLGAADVDIAADTRRLLESLGWTPPPVSEGSA